LRHFNITEPVAVPHLDLGPNEGADAAFKQVEEMAREIDMEFVRVVPPAFGKIFKALRKNAHKFADQVGPSGEEESGEAVFHSFLVSSACYFFGGDMYNAKAMAAAANVDPSSVENADLDFFNLLTRIESEDIDRAYLTLPTEQVVAMATLLRGAAPRALKFLELESLSDSEVDVVCTVVAPIFVYWIGLIREDICVDEIELLAPVLSLMDPERSLSA
jgi:hypothetical protein